MVVDLLANEIVAKSAGAGTVLQGDLSIAHPFADRHAKAFLRTIQDLVRQVGLEG
ncbi:MAG: hypothetical protein RLZZ273_983, partial [Bacteroidota bacterium]